MSFIVAYFVSVYIGLGLGCLFLGLTHAYRNKRDGFPELVSECLILAWWSPLWPVGLYKFAKETK